MKKRVVLVLLILLVVACSGPETAAPAQSAVEAVEVSPTEVAVEVEDAVEDVEAAPTEVEVVEPAPTEIVEIEPTAETTTVEEVVEEVATAEPVAEAAAIIEFKIESWADNWFAAYLGDDLIVEDSVSITTERSFNAETATFSGSYPLNLNFILKDFKENDTGLEYIGSGRQQMGDGGFITQITDLSSGEVVAISDQSFVCTVIHEAPFDKSCEQESNPVAGEGLCGFSDLGEPDGWKSAEFDDSSWTATTIHSEADVSPKDGYNAIRWDSSAQLIWGPDLETNNTLLCRITVGAPTSAIVEEEPMAAVEGQ